MKTEQWKPVVGYDGIYEISDLGRVKRIGKCTASPKERILKTRIGPDGYCVAFLSYSCKVKAKRIHAIVLEAFIGPRPLGMQANHKNGIKTDNQPKNLEWVTLRENIAHATRNGLVPSGENHWNSKLKERHILEIRKRIQTGQTQGKIAAIYKVNRRTISKIGTRKAWKNIK